MARCVLVPAFDRLLAVSSDDSRVQYVVTDFLNITADSPTILNHRNRYYHHQQRC